MVSGSALRFVFAGSLGASGSAALTYISQEDVTVGNPIGMASAVSFTGTGELDNGWNVKLSIAGTDGGGYKNLIYNSDGMDLKKSKKFLEMDGAKIFEFALDEVPAQINKLISKSKNSINSIDYFVFHQANKFLLKTLMKKLKIPSQKIIYSIDDFGNTNAASIPITIFKNLKNKKNLKVLISGFGVGYSWASAILNLNNPKFSSLKKI